MHKLGRLPNNPLKPRLKLSSFLSTQNYPTPPAKVDYLSSIDYWPMYGNDAIGDCTCAAAGHMIQAWTFYGQHDEVHLLDQDIIRAYSAVSGYNPVTGGNDNGAVMQDVLSYWRKTGIGGRKIEAFFEVDINNATELKAALNLFGHVYLGIIFPESAMNQFDTGQPWDSVKGSPIEGGHAIDWGYAENGQNHRVVTWGAVQEMTPQFFKDYVEEAWVVCDQDWIKDNQSPPGLDTHALNVAFQNLTGDKGPFTEGPVVPPAPPAPHKSWLQYIIDWFHKHF